jgi:hypothetical protein
MTPEVGRHRAEINRHTVNLIAMNCENTMPIVGKFGKAGYIAPNLFAARVEEVRAVNVIFDACFRIDLGPRIATDVGPFVQNQDWNPSIVCNPLRDSRTKKAGTNDDNWKVSDHAVKDNTQLRFVIAVGVIAS